MATPAPVSPVRSTRALKIGFGAAGALFSVSALPTVGFLVATSAPDDVGVLELMPFVFAAALLVVTPPLAGFLAAVVPSDPRTLEGRRQFRTIAIVSAALVLIGAVALVISTSLGVASGGVAAGIVGGSIILTVGSLYIGFVIRHRDAARPPATWSPRGLEATTARKNMLRVVWTFVITLLVAAVAFVLLGLVSGEEPRFILTGILLATSIAFIAASVTCLVVVFPLSFRARGIFGGDTPLQRRVSKVVLGRRTRRGISSTVGQIESSDLNSAEQIVAAKYAAVMAALLPFQFAQSALILGAVLFGQLSNLSTRNNDLAVLNLSLIAFVLVAGCAITPFILRQVRRVRQYRDDHHLDSLAT